MTAPTNLAPDQVRQDYIARCYKMSHAELFAELMRVHKEATALIQQSVEQERQECAQVCEDYVKDMDREYKEIGEEMAGLIQARGK